MAMQLFQPTTTHEEHEGEATVATVPKPATRSDCKNESLESKENQPTPQIPCPTVENLGQGVDAAAATSPVEFDDEFLVLRPTLLTGPVTEVDGSPMFADSAGDDWPVGEGPNGSADYAAVAPLDGVSVCDPKIGVVANPIVEKLVNHFAEIRELETAIADTCSEEANLKEKAKGLRKRRERLVEALQNLKGENVADTDDDDDDELDDDDNELGGEAKAATPSRPQDWGTDGVEVLESHGLKLAKVEALRAASDAGHFDGTIRGLRDWIAKSDLWHRNVKGCGPTGADKIGDALTSYLKANPVADEPMTAEDERRSEAAAIALGHVKPAMPVVLSGQCLDPLNPNCNCEAYTAVTEATSSIKVETKSGEIVDVNLAIARQNPFHDPESEAIIDYANPIDAPPVEPASPPQAKKPRKPRAKKVPAASSAPLGTFHDVNAGQLDRVSAMMSGESDPAATITTEAEATLAGEAAGKSDQSCSANPFPRDHAFGKAWQAGWEATAAGAV